MTFSFMGATLNPVVFRAAPKLELPTPRDTDTAFLGAESGLVTKPPSKTHTTSIEKFLDKMGFKYTKEDTTSDRDTTAQISLVYSYMKAGGSKKLLLNDTA